MDRLFSYSNEKTITTYQKKFGYSKEVAKEHFVEMLRFLNLCAAKKEEETYTPSEIIDNIWHIFLKTNEYKAFCIKNFGKVINHTVGKRISIEDYLRTKDAITNLYNQKMSNAIRPNIYNKNFKLMDCSGD